VNAQIHGCVRQKLDGWDRRGSGVGWRGAEQGACFLFVWGDRRAREREREITEKWGGRGGRG